jgi:protein-tyrosine phosphatase
MIFMSTKDYTSGDSRHERHVPLEGQTNFRDLGGYETDDGRTVKWGQVYRSGRLSKLTDHDLVHLESLGIRTVVNLLTEDDIEVYGRNRLPIGAREASMPIDSDTATELANLTNDALKSGDFSMIPGELNSDIHRILIHDGQQQYAALLREIANLANRPLVFHCSHGVHRTGTGAAILLSALGVPWETVREDYLLSNTYRHDEVRRRLVQLRQLAAEKQGIVPEEVDMGNMEAFLIQDGSYIDASYDEIIKVNGSMSEYISEGLGLTESVLIPLQESLLDG